MIPSKAEQRGDPLVVTPAFAFFARVASLLVVRSFFFSFANTSGVTKILVMITRARKRDKGKNALEKNTTIAEKIPIVLLLSISPTNNPLNE